MLILLLILTGLTIWSLRLMQSALRLRDFSLMFAGTLVALSAAGIIVVYILMEGCMGYLSAPAQPFPLDTATHLSGAQSAPDLNVPFANGVIVYEPVVEGNTSTF